jgi:prepilin-type N-terminal cleavage/methylation domain-containing protein
MSVMVRKCGGFTLIEMIITIVIIGVGLTGVLLTFQVTVKSSADPLVTKQLISIAEAQMEGAMLKEFASLVDDSACAACPSGYTAPITVTTPTADWEGIPKAQVKTITVNVAYGTQSFQLINRRTNYAP